MAGLWNYIIPKTLHRKTTQKIPNCTTNSSFTLSLSKTDNQNRELSHKVAIMESK